MSSPLPVILDAGPAVHQQAGLRRYTEQLAIALNHHCDDRVKLSLFYNQHSNHQLPATLRSLPAQTISLGQYAWRLSVLASQITHIPYYPLRHIVTGSRLYHASEHLLPRLKIPTVMTVHDLIFERFPQHHKATNRAFLRVGMPLFVRAADRIIAVSHHTKSDLVSLYEINPAKVEVIYEGVDEEFQPATLENKEAIRARYSPDRPYLLMLGTLEPRKNHLLALSALTKLKSLGYPHRLLIGGGKGWLFEPIQAAIAEMGLVDDVSLAGYIPAIDLPGLYSAATALLMPSQYEGFGFPLLEAMACGTPVVASNASSLPELAGDSALLIDPNDLDGFTAAIRSLIDEPELATSLCQRGIQRAQSFSWKSTALQTAALYAEVAQLP